MTDWCDFSTLTTYKFLVCDLDLSVTKRDGDCIYSVKFQAIIYNRQSFNKIHSMIQDIYVEFKNFNQKLYYMHKRS